jgi:hypothetical protein
MSGLSAEVVGVKQGGKGVCGGERVGEGVGAKPLGAFLLRIYYSIVR